MAHFLCFSCQSIHTMEHDFYECPEYMSNTPGEGERPEEYEYEVGSPHHHFLHFVTLQSVTFKVFYGNLWDIFLL